MAVEVRSLATVQRVWERGCNAIVLVGGNCFENGFCWELASSGRDHELFLLPGGSVVKGGRQAGLVNDAHLPFTEASLRTQTAS